MNESFLHFVWQFDHFHKNDLLTNSGEPIQILSKGSHNTNAGPDFLNARLLIDNIEWHGNIEIHIKSSDWKIHGHDSNGMYNNVILHIVWDYDKAAIRSDGTEIPVLELKSRVDTKLIYKYRSLIDNKDSILCSSFINNITKITWLLMLDKAAVQRLENKTSMVKDLLTKNSNDWEEASYRLLARNFGFKVNGDPFFNLTKSLPLKIVMKHSDNLPQLEALLFGQAGFLSGHIEDDYFMLLKREYSFLSHKYNLLGDQLCIVQWNFLRLRPANFPTVRIAQLAGLLHKHHHLFSLFKECTYKELIKELAIKPSSYWTEHYHFGKKLKRKSEGLGNSSIQNLLINTIAPLLATYGRIIDDQLYIDKALDMMHQLPAEKNHITSLWKKYSVDAKSAFDSQSLIEIYNNFCRKKKCLSCNLGIDILKKA